jgi:small conductance mechanosensitive channel
MSWRFYFTYNKTNTSMDKVNMYSDLLIQSLLLYAPKVGAALLVFVIGLWLTNWFTRLLTVAMTRKGFDISLQSFLASLLNVSLKVLLLVTVAGMLGIQTTSFVAVLGAAGLAVGLALQGSLSNFAGGVLTLVFKPYKVGDLIEAQGQFGEVKEIQIFNTILLTPENKTVILPNGAVSNGTIVNFSRHGDLRVDIALAVDPGTDIAKARQVILAVCGSNEKVLKTPAPSVSVLKMADGAVTLAIRPYATPANYWDVYFGIQEEIKIAFEQAGIQGPTPHRVIITKS